MSAIIELISKPLPFISIGHDGFFPYEAHPLDEIFIFAYRCGKASHEQFVEIFLPIGMVITIENSYSFDAVRVHKSGFLWHDRTREIKQPITDEKWLSAYGFTVADPRKVKPTHPKVFAALSGKPEENNFRELFYSKEWKQTMRNHTQHRDWMPHNLTLAF